jgi:hypothetical protein
MFRRLGFPLATLLSLSLATARVDAATAHISWTITPGTETYVNDQTKIAFRKFVGGFSLNRANPGKEDGTASFGYWGKRGIITVYLMHRGPAGCGKGEDCARAHR